MQKMTLAAALFALTAGVAQAQTNPGVAQLAGLAGVSADGFTQAQLIQLIEAQRDGDTDTVNFILSQRGADVGRADTAGFGSSAGKAQLAAQAGVNPDDYSLAELIALTSNADKD